MLAHSPGLAQLHLHPGPQRRCVGRTGGNTLVGVAAGVWSVWVTTRVDGRWCCRSRWERGLEASWERGLEAIGEETRGQWLWPSTLC